MKVDLSQETSSGLSGQVGQVIGAKIFGALVQATYNGVEDVEILFDRLSYVGPLNFDANDLARFSEYTAMDL
jgi:hypothetical protein